MNGSCSKMKIKVMLSLRKAWIEVTSETDCSHEIFDSGCEV
jgi:hypothetical protein